MCICGQDAYIGHGRVRETKAEKSVEAGVWGLEYKHRAWSLFCLQLRTLGT